MKNHVDFLIAIAMREEAQGLFEREGIPVLYTGLGKVNAACRLLTEIKARQARGQQVRAVFNFGTAGSPRFKTHDLVECTKFVQRDMDVSALGFAPGTTPFDEHPPMIEMLKRLPHLPEGICGTGDSFETGRPRVACDVVDMEAYALAKVCRFEGLPMVSVKFISDGADDSAHKDWAANLPMAAARFLDVYRDLIASWREV